MQSPIDFSSVSPAPVCCYAIDRESTKLAIPVLHVRQTTGLQRLTPTPALCRLFMDGRCRQGSQCNQIHADAAVVRQLRREVLAAPPCCQMHTPSAAAAAQQEAGTSANQVVVIDGEAVPTALFCPTVGLHTVLAKNRGNASTKDLCRSHVSGGLCRYGDDCNYLHLCKTMINRLTSAEMPANQILTPITDGEGRRTNCCSNPLSSILSFHDTTHPSPPPPMPTFVVPKVRGRSSVWSVNSFSDLLRPVGDNNCRTCNVDLNNCCHQQESHRDRFCVQRDSPCDISNTSLSRNGGSGGGGEAAMALSAMSSPMVSVQSSPFKMARTAYPAASGSCRWSHNPYMTLISTSFSVQ